MNEQLLRHAIQTVWCNPAQDRQYVYRLQRLSRPYGVQGSIDLFYERVRLPTADRYHVYQLGKVLPFAVGLPDSLRQWTTLATLANERLLMSDVYLDNGIQFPRFQTYVWITQARNVVIAVKLNPKIHTLEQQDLYLRLYSNAYFSSERSQGRRHLTVVGQEITSSNDLLLLQNRLQTLVNTQPGLPFYYVNGRFVHNISPTTAEVGDVVEFVLDGSIKRMVEWDIKDLTGFHSQVDGVRKLILHYDDPSVTGIEYLDDVDIFLLNPLNSGRFMGVYYHHNEAKWLRMLTHKDYSIPSSRIDSFVHAHPTDPRHATNPALFPKDEWTSAEQLRLRLYIRESGYDRPLGPDAHRIQELYKLPSATILKAMAGEDATLDLWRAENLEQSPYVRFMSAPPAFVHPIAFNDPSKTSPGKEAAQELVGDVFGYHAAATILANTPNPVELIDGQRTVHLSFEHWQNATVFEYDTDGLLLGYYRHTEGEYYTPRKAATAYVEVLTGKPGLGLTTTFGAEPVALKPGYNARFYISTRYRGETREDWVDITESEERDQYGYLDTTTSPHQWVWTLDENAYLGAVRQDDRIYVETLDVRKHNGTQSFRFLTEEVRDGVLGRRVMTIPPAQVDLFLNGRSLIEGLDYQIQWPRVVLSNVEYLNSGNNTTPQELVVRAYGFCTSAMERPQRQEWGFLKYGVLSHDHNYAIHTHKVLRVVVDGHYRRPEDLVFDEEQGSRIVETDRNGAPYAITVPPTVFHDVYASDQAARLEDDARDQRVAQYMDRFFPMREETGPDVSVRPYAVHSPFSTKILHDLLNGTLNPAGITEHYNEQDIRAWCKEYEYLLEFDLANQDYDPYHLRIYPHWWEQEVELNLYQLTFYKRILATYLRHPLDIASFVKLD